VHVDPTKATLKAPKTKRSKLPTDGVLSNFAFKLNLRRYTKEWEHIVKIGGASERHACRVIR
jgi:hypothetical protein